MAKKTNKNKATPKVNIETGRKEPSIDEFGQFKRKKNWETNSANLYSDIEEEDTTNRSILNPMFWSIWRYFKRLLIPRSGLDFLRLVLFLIFVSTTYWSASSHDNLAMTIVTCLPATFVWIVLEAFMLALREGRGGRYDGHISCCIHSCTSCIEC